MASRPYPVALSLSLQYSAAALQQPPFSRRAAPHEHTAVPTGDVESQLHDPLQLRERSMQSVVHIPHNLSTCKTQRHFHSNLHLRRMLHHIRAPSCPTKTFNHMILRESGTCECHRILLYLLTPNSSQQQHRCSNFCVV
jgi:hypothetical protein